MASLSGAGRPTLRRDAELNRRRIIAAAHEVFRERGMAATLNDVAAHAGVGVGTVYRRFANKEELVDALFDDMVDTVAALAREAVADPDAWHGLTTSLEKVCEVQAFDRGLREVMLGTGGGPQRQAQVRERVASAVDLLIARAKEQGMLRGDIVGVDIPMIQLMVATVGRAGINPSKVAVWGQSAGGYLSQSSNVQAVVDEFGRSDLTKLAADYDTATQKENYAAGNSLAQWVFGPGTKKSILDGPAKVVAAADPITYISSSTPPFVELQGTHDQLVSPSQTELVNSALRAKGVDSTRYLLNGANHGDLTFTGNTKAGLPWSTREVMGLIVSFLRQHLGS